LKDSWWTRYHPKSDEGEIKLTKKITFWVIFFILAFQSGYHTGSSKGFREGFTRGWQEAKKETAKYYQQIIDEAQADIEKNNLRR